MIRPPRRIFAAAFGCWLGLAPPLAAQGSPYLQLDDPRLPLVEHLISRGDLADPSPLVRPLRYADVLRALALADTAPETPSGRLISQLRTDLALPESEAWWRAEGRVGGQAYTAARRDPLHPEGPDGVQPYLDLDLSLVAGNLVLASRPIVEPRLADDPDWRGRRDLDVVGRMGEAYLSGQWRWAELFYGQLDRNWGPVGLPGLPLSDVAYSRSTVGGALRTRDLSLVALAAQLGDEIDSTGARVHRYHFLHRLGLRLSDRLHLAVWEATLVQGVDQEFDGRFRNPVALLLLANTYGLGHTNNNVMVGLDAHWRAGRRLTLQAQLAVDDINYLDRNKPDRAPDRWAATLAAFGPLGRRLAWRALYTRATSLAFRTASPFETYADQGVGLSRNFADNDQATLLVTVPVGRRWLLTPELTVLRQGEGRLTDPFPSGTARGQTPQIFIGVVERTWRTGLAVSGRQGPLEVRADGGLHYVENADHVAGASETRFEGRLSITLGLGREGALR